MYDKFKLGLFAALFAFTLALAGSVFADDKKAESTGCGYCDAVTKVCSMMRCDACKSADKQCAHCAETAQKMEKAAMCKKCMEAHKAASSTQPVAACGECTAKMPKEKGHCEFCMDKKMVADHMFCCAKCEAANMTSCPKCKEMRDAVMAVKCPTCDAGAK